MELSLRKGNALQLLINDKIKSINLVASIDVNEFVPVETQLNEGLLKVLESASIRCSLLNILYAIRAEVSRLNTISGINDLLTELALLDAKQNIYSSLINENGVRQNLQILEGQILKQKDAVQQTYFHRGPICSSVLKEEDIVNLKEDLLKIKREKQSKKDKLLELNLVTKLQLDDKSYQFLQEQAVV